MKTKYYHVFGRTTTEDGSEHVVTIVGKFEQTRKKTEVNETVDVETINGGFTNGKLTYSIKKLHRKLTLGLAICHPSDEFDEEIGVEVAKKRINEGINLGSIETNDVTMLTEDAIFAELMVKLNHVMENLTEYLPNED